MKKNNYKDYAAMSRAAADIVVATVKAKPNAVLGLPTGSTPIGMYAELVKDYKAGKVDFSEVTTFNLDEYIGLDTKHEQSYRRFMQEQLFDHINIKPSNTHIPSGTAKDLNKAAKEFEDLLKKSGGVDLFVLGIGTNGHIGFNEPAASMPAYTHVVGLAEETIKVNADKFFAGDMKAVPKTAVSMGLATIMKANKIILLSNGESKNDAIAKIDSQVLTLDCPATVLHMHRDVTLLIS
ncbi:MAG: glucosamine-6-phosphate deaminase [Firmicutes bacterium]|nr:glucosamine-6-phosphate deaminase [Bacillota bacterium]